MSNPSKDVNSGSAKKVVEPISSPSGTSGASALQAVPQPVSNNNNTLSVPVATVDSSIGSSTAPISGALPSSSTTIVRVYPQSEAKRKAHQPRAAILKAAVPTKSLSSTNEVSSAFAKVSLGAHIPLSKETLDTEFNKISSSLSDFASQVEDELLDTCPFIPKKRKYATGKGDFNVNLYVPFSAPLPSSPASLPPIQQNGSLVDAATLNPVPDNIIDLTEEERYCIVLLQVLASVDPIYIKEYLVANGLPMPVDVVVIEAAAKALLFFLRKEEFDEVKVHSFAIGRIDREALLNPKADHGAYFRIFYAFRTCHLLNVFGEMGSALASFDVRVISADKAKKESKFITVYVASLKDYIRVFKHTGDLIIESPNGELTILTPRLDLATTSTKEVSRLYIGGLPPNCSEEKVLALLRHTVEKDGGFGEDVLSFHIHRQKGNSRSSFGFAQVLGPQAASTLISTVISVRGTALIISFASAGASSGNKRKFNE